MDQSQDLAPTDAIRACDAADLPTIDTIINQAAEAYRGVIPADCWHEPYMARTALEAEIAAGVSFTGYRTDGALVGVMGLQPVGNVRLIRHAYVLPQWQGHGIGSRLLQHLCADGSRPTLIGTWRAADWAIRFYQRHDFELVPRDAIAPLLKTYWSVPDRQVETSVVLSSLPLTVESARRLIAGFGRPERDSASIAD